MGGARTRRRVVTRIGAIDIGTNSVRLLVAEVDGTGPDAKLLPLERRMTITRLGQGVDRTRALAPEAIARTVDVLREYRGVLDGLGVTQVRATATSAARDATNRDDFFGAAWDEARITPELLSGDEEARLSFLGATADLDAPGPFLVVDIGGGSTEFVVGSDAPTGLVSLDIGCVRVTEQYLESDPPAPEELSNAVAVVRDLVADVPRLVPGATEAATLVGLAGTVTTVAAIELGLSEYDAQRIHHFRLTRDAAEDVFRTLATESAAQRAHNPGLEPGRVDVIVGGVIVLVAVMRVLGFDEMLVSEADILDGLVRSQA
jgi:exopolyphosphatase/guanosine-5'-triphosphate,3'-diphosphate pyrophosphatase